MSQDSTIYRDSYGLVQATITNGAGVAVDVTGWTVSYRIGKRFDRTSNVFTKAGSVSDGPNGVVQAVIDVDDLDLLTKPQYSHQFNLTNLSGQPWPPVDGVLTILDTIPASA